MADKEKPPYWMFVEVKNVFHTRFLYRPRYTMVQHFANHVYWYLKRNKLNPPGYSLATEIDTAYILRDFLIAAGFGHELPLEGRVVDDDLVRLNEVHHLTAEERQINALRVMVSREDAFQAMSKRTKGLIEDYYDPRIGWLVPPVMFCDWVIKPPPLWSTEVKQIVSKQTRKHMKRVNDMLEKVNLVTDTWLWKVGLGSQLATAKFRALHRSVLSGKRFYNRGYSLRPSKRKLNGWMQHMKEIAGIGEMTTFTNEPGCQRLLIKRQRRVMSEKYGPIPLDRVIFVNHVEAYINANTIASRDVCAESLWKVIGDADGASMTDGLEDCTNGIRVDYRLFINDSYGEEEKIALAKRLRPLLPMCNIFYFPGNKLVAAQFSDLRYCVWKILNGVEKERLVGRTSESETITLIVVFWLDNKGRKSRLAVRLIETSNDSVLFAGGCSDPQTVAVYLGHEKDFLGFKMEFTHMLNEMYLNPMFQFDSGQRINVKMGIMLGDHKALWSLFGIPAKPSKWSDVFSMSDLSSPFVLHQGAVRFSAAAIRAARLEYAPSANIELHSDSSELPDAVDKNDDAGADISDPEPDKVNGEFFRKGKSNDRQLWIEPEDDQDDLSSRGHMLKWVKRAPLFYDDVVFPLESVIIVPPILHNVVHGLCLLACQRVIALLPSEHEDRKKLARHYQWVIGIEGDASIVASGALYRKLLDDVMILLVPACAIGQTSTQMLRGFTIAFWSQLAVTSSLLVQDLYSDRPRTREARCGYRVLSFFHYYNRTMWDMEEFAQDMRLYQESKDSDAAAKKPKNRWFKVYEKDVECSMPELDDLIRIPWTRINEEQQEAQFKNDDAINLQKRTKVEICAADQRMFYEDITNSLLCPSRDKTHPRSCFHGFHYSKIGNVLVYPDVWGVSDGCNGSRFSDACKVFAHFNLRNFITALFNSTDLKDVVTFWCPSDENFRHGPVLDAKNNRITPADFDLRVEHAVIEFKTCSDDERQAPCSEGAMTYHISTYQDLLGLKKYSDVPSLLARFANPLDEEYRDLQFPSYLLNLHPIPFNTMRVADAVHRIAMRNHFKVYMATPNVDDDNGCFQRIVTPALSSRVRGLNCLLDELEKGRRNTKIDARVAEIKQRLQMLQDLRLNPAAALEHFMRRFSSSGDHHKKATDYESTYDFFSDFDIRLVDNDAPQVVE